MKSIAEKIRAEYPDIKLLIGGAPVNENFKNEIGADNYSADPQKAVSYLNSLVA